MIDVAPTTVMPTSWVALVGSITGIGTFLFLIFDRVWSRSRTEADVAGKLEDLCEKFEELEGRLIVVDGLKDTVRDLVVEWRGVDGSNGYKSIIRNDHEKIKAIEKRNDRIDAAKEEAIRIAHEEDMRRSGGVERRYMDRQLGRILPEDRKDEP